MLTFEKPKNIIDQGFGYRLLVNMACVLQHFPNVCAVRSVCTDDLGMTKNPGANCALRFLDFYTLSEVLVVLFDNIEVEESPDLVDQGELVIWQWLILAQKIPTTTYCE